jgi:hypothetical protein
MSCLRIDSAMSAVVGVSSACPGPVASALRFDVILHVHQEGSSAMIWFEVAKSSTWIVIEKVGDNGCHAAQLPDSPRL